jgi:UDP-4-amino-4,6-dideoxy-N-acetyl-beta-L-altrosamine transaminase
MIPYGRQIIDEDDIRAVEDVLRSNYLTQGPAVPAFESAIEKHTSANHAVAVNSATSALHIACLALDLGAGDVLWTSPITFVASANCARYCGAEVDFVDIDADTFNISVDALELKLANAAKSGRLPKILVAVHMCGQSPDMQRISALARAYDVRIIEDASHAIGAEYLGLPVGQCNYSDITVFSFHPVKIITTAEGGVLTTNAPDVAAKLKLLRSHGITRDPLMMTHEPDGPWYYQQVDLGWNYRMTEMQAALGSSQMTKLLTFVARRRVLADIYDDAFVETSLKIPGRLKGANSSWHLYILRLKNAESRRFVFEKLSAEGIGVNVHYIPVHLQPYYRSLGFSQGQFPVAEDFYNCAISIPLYAGLSDSDQERVVNAVLSVSD